MARNFVRASSQAFTYSGTPITVRPITLACWFRCTDTTNSQDLLTYSHNSGAPQSVFRLNVNGAATTVRCVEAYSVSGNKISTAAGTWSSGVWAHGAATTASSGASRIGYLNGVAGTAETTSLTFGTSDVIDIGRVNLSTVNSNYFNGDLAEAAIWNAELSAAQIASLATGLSPLMVQPDLLVGYWPLLGSTSGANEIDRVGGLTMTAVASPATAAHSRVFYPARRQFRYGVTAAGGLKAHPFFGGGASANPLWGYIG